MMVLSIGGTDDVKLKRILLQPHTDHYIVTIVISPSSPGRAIDFSMLQIRC